MARELVTLHLHGTPEFLSRVMELLPSRLTGLIKGVNEEIELMQDPEITQDPDYLKLIMKKESR